MALKLKVRQIDIEGAAKHIVLLNSEDAAELGLVSMDRAKLLTKNKVINAIVNVTRKVVPHGSIGVLEDLSKELSEGEAVIIEGASAPESVHYIKKKLQGNYLDSSQIHKIVQDVANLELTDVESTYFISSAYVKEFSNDEIVALTEAMVKSGQTLKFNKGPIVDKHSIGGIPGNRATMLIVPIISAAGLTIPKTSARAISSASGTADAMEVMAPVSLSLEEVKNVVLKTNACLVWGGSINLVPADDIMNKLRYPLRLDPKPFLLASILAKKKSVGAEKVIIDIPTGKGAKISTEEEAKSLAYSFISLGAKLGMEVQCAITPGDQPIGRGIGPALEARDVLNCLHNRPDAPQDLIEKSVSLAGILLEIGRKAQKGEGEAMAREILASGKAARKMKEIIEAQGGNPKVTVNDLPLGKEKTDIRAKHDGKIDGFDNGAIISIARAAGAPKNKGAGLFLNVERGQNIKKGDVLFTIYAEKPQKLESAVKLAETTNPLVMERSILGLIEGKV